MASETLRKLASALRAQANEEARSRRVKCAHVLLAAKALALLQEKVAARG